ncbi:hypothetical protein N7E81_09740 [Reichenbachiella carrageenanivorans]|uniref:Uncharacterized protein n=1 Tax=Reichenbachiella carrageenanivorans TaxID=2979869 RepID=A0ABY6CUQ6_9BACT|nr:hypothetical protein [Reichenbachiella carrageenanivorans]UXX77650.1 hypothetical protein N7E81_09740 [Reichenbachiella carrageenanivorans]
MAFYQFLKTQVLDASIEEVWGLILSPDNLKKIIPAHMGFNITSPYSIDKMYEGMIIAGRGLVGVCNKSNKCMIWK